MRFRLKDRELQKKLDEISKGDLSDALEVCSAAVASALKRGKPTTIWFGVQPQLSLEITSDMLEEVREYDPRAWNDYSKVNPPEGVLMRVECHDGSKACAQLRFFEREGFCRPEGLWCDIDGTPWPIADSDAVVRFRPWDDPDGEEDEE
nr:MAG TPA: hypothetical protein [Caudoviricetes sp.]